MTTTIWLEAKSARTDHTGTFHAYHRVFDRLVGPYCGLRLKMGAAEAPDPERQAQGTQCARCLKAIEQRWREGVRRFGAPNVG